MIKLYKREGNSTSYWEAWADGRTVITHWGTVGDTGKSRQIPLQKGASAKAAIAAECKMPLAEGFQSLPLEEHATVIVQYRTEGWGSTADLDKRHRVEGILDECLGWTGNGHCDGGDIGSGTINAFALVVDPIAAAAAIVKALKQRGLLGGAVIAFHQGEEPPTVLFPEDFEGKFSVT